MFRVKLINIKDNNRQWQGEFSSYEEAQVWLDRQKTKPDRRPEREILDKSEQFDESDVISERFVVQEDGSELRYVILAAEATYEGPTDISSEVAQNNQNKNLLKFLNETDWKVLRHRDQLDLGVSTSLSNEEYQSLLQQRQEARQQISR